MDVLCAWGRRALCMLALSCAGSACTTGIEQALAAADVAAARGQPEREEALLKTVAMRLSRARARGHAPATTVAQERLLLTRLGGLYAGPLHDLNAAISVWQHVLTLEPSAEEAGSLLMTLADLIGHRQGDRALAAQHFERAGSLLGNRPAAASALLAAAQSYLALGNASRTLSLCEQVTTTWQGSLNAARATLVAGEAKVAMGDWAGAIEDYLHLLEQRPSRALASVTKAKLAQAHQARGESAQALDYYHAALQGHPNAPMIQDAIARVREQMVQIAPHKSILRGASAAAQVARR